MRNRSHSRLDRAATLIAASLFTVSIGAQPDVGRQADASVILPTGQRITPAGTQIVVDSLPIAASAAPSGRHLLVLQTGFETPAVSVLDTVARSVGDRVQLPDAWLGLTFNQTGERVYVGGGARRSAWELSFRSGKLQLEREFAFPDQCTSNCASLIGDVLLDQDDRTLYALDLLRDRVIVVNAQSGLVLGEFETGMAPYRAKQTPDGQHLLISHWGEASVGLYRLSDRRLVERIPVGEHPTDLQVVAGEVQVPGTGDEMHGYPARLFAACSHANNLWTFGITAGNRFDLLDARSVAPLPNSPVGSLPSALGVSHDKHTLYIANAGDNVILTANIEDALPQPDGSLPTGWFPTAVVGLNDGALAYLSGKGDFGNPGLVGLLPPLSAEQLDFLTAAAVANLPSSGAGSTAPPAAVRHVALVLTETRGAVWQILQEQQPAYLGGYLAPARGQLGQVAWLTSGIETDFFAKLGPAVHAGRLSVRDLACAGRAAAPPAGTLWSNAREASISTDTYGIAGGRPPSAFVAEIEAGQNLPGLAVVRLSGSAAEQNAELGRLLSALQDHDAYAATAIFVVSTDGQAGAAVSGGAVLGQPAPEGLITAPAVLRTITWLLGLRPLTQATRAAAPLTELFVQSP